MIWFTAPTKLMLYYRPRLQLSFSSARRATNLSGNGSGNSGLKDLKYPYPYPAHPRPTPHEIFHLPRGASSAEIKSRYYDLVRYHHPDSPHARTHTPSPDERRIRFQSILSAYHALRFPSGTRTGKGHYGHGSGFDPFINELNRRRRTSDRAEWMKQQKEKTEEQARARERGEWSKTAGGLKERLMVVFGVIAVLGGLYPSFVLFPFRREQAHQDAVVNLTQARSDAQVVGHMRREEVRRRAKDIRAARELERQRTEVE